MKISIPNDVTFIIETLEKFGYEAYVVGGCVRDCMLGIAPNDWDITTSAKPEQIKECFNSCEIVLTGETHGTVGVIINKVLYEITTFRLDGIYTDNRHPEKVEFTTDLNEDLARRDFTVNAMAYNSNTGLIDPFNGAKDLQIKAIRTVGNPDVRFNEDALRILRALRFASTYNFNIDVYTASSILKNRNLLNNISYERVSSEFNKLICGENIGYVLRRYKDVISVIFPEIVSTFDFEQNNPYHNKTVWKHTTVAVANVESDLLLRMVMFLHDIGKPLACKVDANGVDHFAGHNRFGASIAKSALERLKYPKKFIDDVVTLIEYHDINIEENKRNVKHILNKIGEVNFERLLKVKLADISAKSGYKKEFQINNICNVKEIYIDILLNGECYKLKDLKISGTDLIHLGITNGLDIGVILEQILIDVINDEVDNDTVSLKKLALQINSQLANKETDN